MATSGAFGAHAGGRRPGTTLSQGLRDAAQPGGKVGVRQVSEVAALAVSLKELKSAHILAPGRDIEADVGHHPVGVRTGRAPVNDAGVFDDRALYMAFGDTRRDTEYGSCGLGSTR